MRFTIPVGFTGSKPCYLGAGALTVPRLVAKFLGNLSVFLFGLIVPIAVSTSTMRQVARLAATAALPCAATVLCDGHSFSFIIICGRTGSCWWISLGLTCAHAVVPRRVADSGERRLMTRPTCWSRTHRHLHGGLRVSSANSRYADTANRRSQSRSDAVKFASPNIAHPTRPRTFFFAAWDHCDVFSLSVQQC